jgi:hypothetical protein
MGEDMRNQLPLTPGTRVRVRNRFDHSFAAGFEVQANPPSGYRVVRVSDRSSLPAAFAPEDVEPDT